MKEKILKGEKVMFKKPPRDKRTNLEKEIDEVIDEMHNYSSASEDYTKMTVNLERLYKAKAQERDRRVSPDTIAVIAGNLIGIALIIGYEQANIITTKALGFVMKGRV